MIDTAQLREALDRILHNFQMSSEVGIPIVRESEWEVAFKAAEKYLTLREAGALTHDKNRDCARTDEVLENYKRRALAAELRLVQMEAGALIITPDEKTVELIAHQICSVLNPELPYRRAPAAMRSTCRQEARSILDALRDAMPDGGGE